MSQSLPLGSWFVMVMLIGALVAMTFKVAGGLLVTMPTKLLTQTT